MSPAPHWSSSFSFWTSFSAWTVAFRSVPQSVTGPVILALTAFRWSLAPGRRVGDPGITGIPVSVESQICKVGELAIVPGVFLLEEAGEAIRPLG